MSRGKYALSRGKFALSRGKYAISEEKYALSRGKYALSRGKYNDKLRFQTALSSGRSRCETHVSASRTLTVVPWAQAWCAEQSCLPYVIACAAV